MAIHSRPSLNVTSLQWPECIPALCIWSKVIISNRRKTFFYEFFLFLKFTRQIKCNLSSCNNDILIKESFSDLKQEQNYSFRPPWFHDTVPAAFLYCLGWFLSDWASDSFDGCTKQKSFAIKSWHLSFWPWDTFTFTLSHAFSYLYPQTPLFFSLAVTVWLENFCLWR